MIGKIIKQISNDYTVKVNDKLYVCDEDRDRIIYSTKVIYDSQCENKFLDELGEDFPYILFDICYMDYLENGKPALTLKKV